MTRKLADACHDHGGRFLSGFADKGHWAIAFASALAAAYCPFFSNRRSLTGDTTWQLVFQLPVCTNRRRLSVHSWECGQFWTT